MAIDNKEKEVLNVPPLRFPEFTGEWQCKAIEKVAPLQRGFDLPTQNLVEGIYPVIYSNGILQHHDKYKCEAPGLITGRSGTIGKFTYIDSGFYWPHNTSLWVTDFCGNCPKFIYYLYQTVHIEQFSTGSGVPTLNRNDVHRYKTSVPTAIVEQEKIAKFLSILDERIVTQNKIIEDLKKLKSAIRKKMFSFLKDEYTESFEINQLLDYEQPTAYIVANDEYSTDTSLTPVLTANKGFILGYTDEKFGIYQKGECIIFDDFTMDAKYVSFPFKVKSSAIKILTAKPNVNLRFMFEYLSYWELKSEEHKRHYISEIASLVIELPSKERQSIIASLMTSLNSKLDIEAKTKIRYEEQKRYLLSQMFI